MMLLVAQNSWEAQMERATAGRKEEELENYLERLMTGSKFRDRQREASSETVPDCTASRAFRLIHARVS
jgi:hypothetical protein